MPSLGRVAADPPGPLTSSSDRPLSRSERDRTLTLLATIVAVVLSAFALRELRDALLPVVLSILLFYALDPIVDYMSKWLPRALATVLVIGTLVGGMVAGVYALADQAQGVVADLPEAVREFRATLNSREFRNGTLAQVQQAAREIERTAAEVAGPATSTRVQVADPPFSMSEYMWWGSIGTAAAIGQAAVILFLTFFLVYSNDLYRQKIVRLVGPQLTNKKITLQVLISIEEQMKQFLGVQILTSTLVGIATWVALWALGLEHAAVWGVAAGVLNWIPIFGPLVVTVGLTVVAWMQFADFWNVAAVAGTALAITTVEGFFLTPVLLGRAARMNNVAVFVSLLFWSWVWGVFGALLAVPIMMAVKATCDHVDALRPMGEFLGE